MARKSRVRVMIPVEEVDIAAVKYEPQVVRAPRLDGFVLRIFVWFIECKLFGSAILSVLKRMNNFTQMLQETVIPEKPMFRPEYPPQGFSSTFTSCALMFVAEESSEILNDHLNRYSREETMHLLTLQIKKRDRKQNCFSPRSRLVMLYICIYDYFGTWCNFYSISVSEEEAEVVVIENEDPAKRAELALSCLPSYEPSKHWNADSSFLYWTIQDYAHAYRMGITTPSAVAEHIITVVDDYNNKKPPMPLLIYFDANEVRKLAASSTRRFLDGKPLSILDGIFMPIKDDVDCMPYPTNGATTWYHKVHPVNEDAVCVFRLRKCGVIFIGKANMHEVGLGTTGNNPNYGTTRNPHGIDRYSGGSSSGPAAIVSCGLCPAAIGTDGGGSIRIPSSLCGVVGLKTTYGRTYMKGVMCDVGTVEVVSPIAATVEDVTLVYAVISGASSADKISLNPLPPSVPILSSPKYLDILRSSKLGKYTEWFNDVKSPEISSKCDDVLHMLSSTYGCQIIEIILPELQEMTMAHVVSIGSESLCSLNPDCNDGKLSELTLDARTNLALFRSFTAADYVAAQRLRRRIMYYHMQAFEKVDFIVTPTSGMTAPTIHSSALKSGESSLQVSGYLMRFILAANLLGFPAISIPVGHDKEGLPIGIQLIGRPWGEASILRMASAIEELCLASRRRPQMFYDVLRENC